MKESSKKGEGKQSFIAEARREQMFEAAIRTLDEIGYVNASLAQIAKRAGISTALISYHFADKSDLMNHLLVKLLEMSTTYILDRVHAESTARGKLGAFIEASLAYQVSHPAHNTALIEIIFNSRTPDNVPYYKMDDDNDDEDYIRVTLLQVLREGRENGEFGAFNADAVASVIQGAIGEYMLTGAAITKKVDVETYSAELIGMIEKSILVVAK
ncbi:TetR/AcrR family transcriptional regulator [Paenibacillus arenilitoris]|uniref:TetR family transcriptional regulator n=1 Tax=Paenibacillus arenilitoris TaxID=2772299 RepID=A0A927H994_9BACL|nr:TetR family transcriptional regulator [Paenibacillus arenilitoris]MBD2871384.1 TetR family transcriptional regulator [Paenibacillus arenilitoris]